MSLVILLLVQSTTGWHAKSMGQLTAMFVNSVAEFERTVNQNQSLSKGVF